MGGHGALHVLPASLRVPPAQCRCPGCVSHPDVGEGPHVAAQVQVDVAAGVGEADLGAVGSDDQPVRAVLGGRVGKVQFDDGALGTWSSWRLRWMSQTSRRGSRSCSRYSVGSQRRPTLPAPRPLGAVLAGRCEDVAHPVLVLASLDDAGDREFMQAARQDAGGDVGNPSPQVVETRAAGEQLADDQRCPTPHEDFGRQRDGAELAVSATAQGTPATAVAICYLSSDSGRATLCR